MNHAENKQISPPCLETIQDAKDALNGNKLSTLATAKIVKQVYDQLGDAVSQKEFAEYLEISPGNLSKWLHIGSSKIISDNNPDLPIIFSSLYEMTLLESKYIERYGDEVASKKLSKLINKGRISKCSEQSDIKLLEKEIDDLVASENNQKRQEKIVALPTANASNDKTYDDKSSLSILITENQKFNSFVILPTNKDIKLWKDKSIDESDIHNDFPLSDLRSPSLTQTLTCFIKIPMKNIETGLKMLSGFGFTYRDTFVPRHSGKKGYTLLKSDDVIIRGERGAST